MPASGLIASEGVERDPAGVGGASAQIAKAADGP